MAKNPSSTPKPAGCCPPRVAQNGAQQHTYAQSTGPRPPSVKIPGGKALVGTATELMAGDGESPLRSKRLKPFWMGQTVVTNAQFAEFIAATGYVTEAERFGWSFVFQSQLPADAVPTQGVVDVEWWRRVDGANWRFLAGPGHDFAAELPDHPVVQVSWHDAKTYAAWIGGRLPSEAEWEHAARGGQGDVPFPWGHAAPDDTGHFPCNIWQGQFPQHNTKGDEYLATAPAQSFAANAYGLYNLVGNVWEWTAEPFRIRSQKKIAKARQAEMTGFKLVKGGSFLCHKSYCYRYRIAARTGNSPDSATTHMGFRVVWDS